MVQYFFYGDFIHHISLANNLLETFLYVKKNSVKIVGAVTIFLLKTCFSFLLHYFTFVFNLALFLLK